MEIMAAVAITLGVVLMVFCVHILHQVVIELKKVQQIIVEISGFMNSLSESIQSAKEVINYKKTKLGLGNKDE